MYVICCARDLNPGPQDERMFGADEPIISIIFFKKDIFQR